jgi:hypothetical protein
LPVFELLAGFVRVNHFWPGRLCQLRAKAPRRRNAACSRTMKRHGSSLP